MRSTKAYQWASGNLDCTDLDVGENIFLGREPMAAFNLFVAARYERSQRLLGEFGLDISAKTRCSELSVGARQMIEIARAGLHENRRS